MRLRHAVLLLPAVLYAQDPIPQFSVSYFHALSCPTGWAPYMPAQGRTIVGVAPAAGVTAIVGTPLGSGEVRTHTHQISTSIDTGSNGYFLTIVGCCNSGLATGGSKSISATSGASSSNLPYVQMLACQKQDPPQPGPIPRGTTVFYEGLRCPTGWSDVADAHGRFPVGGDSTQGAFGGPPLAPGEDRKHTLAYSGSVNLPGLSLLSIGGSGQGFAKSGTYGISGTTSAASTGMPYLQLLQCSKDAAGPPTISSVLNVATFASNAIAPGEIIAIFGDNLGPDQGVSAQLVDGKLPLTLSDVKVDIGGEPAPLFYVSKTQINAQVPYDVAVRADVQVSYQEQASSSLTVPAASSSPGLFTYDAPRNDEAIAVLGDQLSSAQLPLSPGQPFLLFATGAGLTNPESQDGVPRNVPLPKPILPVTLTIGGVDATLDYAGAAPGFVGLMQLNARLGDGTPSGKDPVVLKIGTGESPSGVNLYVK
jgi:uncharacterized protein (TIGR03437 family)